MASSSPRMLQPGRHTVNIGPSLGRALKARKLKGSPAPTTTKRSNLPERDFYAFKFKFKSQSVDRTKPATVEVKPGTDQVVVEFQSTVPDEIHQYTGSEQPSKDVDCILIYDEDTGYYTLEKLDSSILLPMNTRIPRRPSPAPIASSSNQDKAKQDSNDRNISVVDEDADGEIDEDVTHAPLIYRREEEEEPEEGEEIEIPRRPVSPPPIPQVPPPKAARSVKPLPKSKAPAAAPPQPTPKAAPPSASAPPRAPSPKARPVAKPKKTKPVAHPPPTTTIYPDEEVIEFGKPAKRARPSTPQQPTPAAPAPAPVSLHLPGGSSSFAPPPAPLKSVVVPPVPAASPPTVVQDDSDEDEEDWEQVSTTAPVVSDPRTGFDLTLEESLEEEIFGNSFAEADGGEEIDANAFEAELNEEMEDSEDDFLTAAVMSDPEQHTKQPISLNRLASGAGAADSEDDFSSSDESDED